MHDPLTLAVDHGYPIIFCMLLVSGLGVPIPEDIPLLAAGLLSHHGGLGLVEASAACGFFVLTRDGIVFFLGRRYGGAILDRPWGQRLISRPALERVEIKIRQRGPLVIFMGRFLPGLRSGVFFAAGTSGGPPAQFFIFDLLAIVISIPLFVWLGHAFAANIELVQQGLAEFRGGLLTLALLALFGLWLKVRRAKAKNGDSQAGP